MKLALLAFGALHAMLYAGLLPLWEGFDEPFHYGYVSRLWRERQFPVLGTTQVSAEISTSLRLAPASYLVKRGIPVVTTYPEYFAMSDADRRSMRDRLERLDPRLADAPDGPNYEAQQAPLAYVLLAPFDILWQRTPLPDRVLRLRLVCGLLSTIATGLLMFTLAGQLGLAERWRHAAVYLALSSQVFYAAVAHVANDWLGVPVFAALVVAGIALDTRPTARRAWTFAAVFSAGLLTKAYFLAAAPLAAFLIGRLLWRRRLPWAATVAGCVLLLAPAAAWYARNVALYRDLSGVQQTARGGVAAGEMLGAAGRMPWLRSAYATAEISLWFGNNSATTFSRKTTAAMILLLAAAAALYAVSARRRWPAAERIAVAAALCYAAGLAYSALLHFQTTHGEMFWAAPWYTQPLYPPAIALLMAGLARTGRTGVVVRAAMIALWTYVLAATYWAKLIPMYAGYPGERARLGDLFRWYTGSFAKVDGMLSTIAPMPNRAIWILAGVATAAGVTLAIALSWPARAVRKT